MFFFPLYAKELFDTSCLDKPIDFMVSCFKIQVTKDRDSARARGGAIRCGKKGYKKNGSANMLYGMHSFGEVR